jgi:hypothetical protein
MASGISNHAANKFCEIITYWDTEGKRKFLINLIENLKKVILSS